MKDVVVDDKLEVGDEEERALLCYKNACLENLYQRCKFLGTCTVSTALRDCWGVLLDACILT
jgi:hypothetical protein